MEKYRERNVEWDGDRECGREIEEIGREGGRKRERERRGVRMKERVREVRRRERLGEGETGRGSKRGERDNKVNTRRYVCLCFSQ